jgi:sugar/nucleoside kinase (ribokinase family)
MIVVAGHLCLDVIPALNTAATLEPGVLVDVGRVSFSSGGAVANVGLALVRLGLEPLLLGRIGDDPFGEILTGQLKEAVSATGSVRANEQLLAGITTASGESTSYSVVISPPDRDRTFLHHPGCNQTFTPADLDVERWLSADLLHFGYPPLMRGVYGDGGEGLAAAFRRLRESGVTVSLDMAMPDPESAAGSVDWRAFLATVLPQVDLFLPSWDETCQMLEPARGRLPATAERLAGLAESLLVLGPALVGLKLGDDGLYLRTADSPRLERAGRLRPPPSWADRELLSPNFRVVARGTTGAGDATIAGLLAALAQGLPLEEAATMASAVGASSVEGVDAVSGVRGWQETRELVARGWERSRSTMLEGSAKPAQGVAGVAEGAERVADGAAGAAGGAAKVADGAATVAGGASGVAGAVTPAGSGTERSQGWNIHQDSGTLLGPHDQGGSR